MIETQLRVEGEVLMIFKASLYSHYCLELVSARYSHWSSKMRTDKTNSIGKMKHTFYTHNIVTVRSQSSLSHTKIDNTLCRWSKRRGKIALVFIASTYDDVIMRSSTFNMWERRRLAKIHSLFLSLMLFFLILLSFLRQTITCCMRCWMKSSVKSSLVSRTAEQRKLGNDSKNFSPNSIGGKGSSFHFPVYPIWILRGGSFMPVIWEVKVHSTLSPSTASHSIVISCWLLCENVNSLWL